MQLRKRRTILPIWKKCNLEKAKIDIFREKKFKVEALGMCTHWKDFLKKVIFMLWFIHATPPKYLYLLFALFLEDIKLKNCTILDEVIELAAREVSLSSSRSNLAVVHGWVGCFGFFSILFCCCVDPSHSHQVNLGWWHAKLNVMETSSIPNQVWISSFGCCCCPQCFF